LYPAFVDLRFPQPVSSGAFPLFIVLTFFLAAGLPAPRAADTQSKTAFTDVTAAAGILHTHSKPILDHQLDNIMPWVCSVGAAAAAGDFNRDGWMDLYVTNSRKGYPNYLYRNNGDGTFTDVAGAAGVADLNNDGGVSMACIWGDFDNDGWPDLYVVRWGYNVLFRNNGNGAFTDVTRQLFRKKDGSPGTDWANGNAAVFLDFNLDGRLDLYVGNYFQDHDLWRLKTTRIMHDSFETARNGGRNSLYRQEPDGAFTEVAASLGVDDPGWTLAVGSADLNNDGWPDLYCANDFGPDQLFLSDRHGGFTNVTAAAIGLDTKKGMNVDAGDFDNDGWLDLYVANITTAEYLQEGNMLWHNDGAQPNGAIHLTDISLETGTYDGGWGWGAKFVDYDNDGDLDIVAVNGFISAGKETYWYALASWTVLGQDPAEARNWPAIGDRSFSGYERMRVWRNDGLYAFSERAQELGLTSTRDGRGLVCFDYNNDGAVDLFIANQGQPPNLYRNNLKSGNHWLTVQLETSPRSKCNRDAIGARVTVVTDSGRQIRERDGGNGFSGQSDPRLHFGVGADKQIKLLEVRWPDGGLEYLENIPCDQLLTIRQNPENYSSKIEIFQGPPKPWRRQKDQPLRVVPEISKEDLDKLLTLDEERLRKSLNAYAPASSYRARCVLYDQHDRSINFFKKLVGEQPQNAIARIQLACAYVDKIPTCGGIAAIVSKGTLARKSLDELDEVLKTQPDSWVARYTRGLNHLHWPRALRHSDDAAEDLKLCLEIQKRAGQPSAKPYYVRTYLALGDACAKAKKYEQARSAWRDGLKAFPKSQELRHRLGIQDNSKLFDYVEAQCSLEKPIDTDLSFLDR